MPLLLILIGISLLMVGIAARELLLAGAGIALLLLGFSVEKRR